MERISIKSVDLNIENGCFITNQTYYTFNKREGDLSIKYKKGRVSSSKWLNDLIY